MDPEGGLLEEREHIEGHRHADMLSVEEARERVLGFFGVLPTERRPIVEALGQVLAEDVASGFDIPPMDNSAMDGYAVQAASVSGAAQDSPRVLKVIGAVAAGQIPDRAVSEGAAVRIMTGAPVPEGADAVVPFEDTDEGERRESGKMDEIGVLAEFPRGANVRPAGQDVASGEVVLRRGAVLRPAEVGVLASLGHADATVVRRPRVAILATGDELTAPGGGLAPGSIYDSNSYGLAAAVTHAGGLPSMLGIARDDLRSLNARIEEGLNADVLITSAGVSKGDYDIVKDVLMKRGALELWSVRMRPAKPLAFGLLSAGGRSVPHLGLPGNPVSALVAFEQFGRPAIHKMMGKPVSGRPSVRAVLDEPIYNTDSRRVYARAVVTAENGAYRARLTGHQSSNLLTSMARANGLAICPEDVPMKEAGETVSVQMLDWPEEVF